MVSHVFLKNNENNGNTGTKPEKPGNMDNIRRLDLRVELKLSEYYYYYIMYSCLHASVSVDNLRRFLEIITANYNHRNVKRKLYCC